MLLHATAIAIDGNGVLLLGESGSGKSDLALRLIHAGALLVADDQVEVDEALFASPPPALQGLLEVREVGIIRYPFMERAPITLAVLMVPNPDVLDRLPELDSYHCNGQEIPLLSLYPFQVSAPNKVKAALYALKENALLPPTLLLKSA